MRIAAFVLVACISCVTPVFAANDMVLRGPAPNWAIASELMPVPEGATGLMFVRRHDMMVHLDGRGQSIYAGYRIKLLHQNALQLGNLSIAWNPSAGAPTVHAIRVHRDGTTMDILERASFEILRREDQLEAARLDGVLTAILRVGDLRVGDELEVAFTTRSTDPTLGAVDAGLLALLSDPAPGRFRLGVSWDEGHEPQLKLSADLTAIAERSGRKLTLQFDNPPMLVAPKDAPARYGWQRVVEYSDFSDWATISRKLAPLFAQSAKFTPNSPLEAEVKRISDAHSNPLDRASAALKLVQQEVRYIYVGLAGGNLKPATADETWQRRYGDCKGKTALLLGFLAELGIEAEPVLVNNALADDGLNERLPSPRLFDHVVVRARIGGTYYWLDGTLPPVAGPSLEPIVPYRWTLPLTAQGKSIERMVWRAPERPEEITLRELDARAGFDQPARIKNTTIIRGIKALEQQIQLSGLTQTQLLSALQQHLVGDTWQTIDDAEWHYDVKAQASVLTISGTGAVDWEDDGGGSKSLILPGGGFNPPQRRIRPAEQNQALPYYIAPDFSCDVTTVRLPKSTRESNWSHNSSFRTQIFGRTYYRAFDLRDGAITMIRGSRVEQQEIDAASAKRDNGRIAAFDNSMAKIYFDPARITVGDEADTIIPTTYEMDWTADNVPCLSSVASDQAS